MLKNAVVPSSIGYQAAAFLVAVTLSASVLHGAPPSLSGVQAKQRQGTKLVDITYNLTDADSATVVVQIEISANGGATYELPVKSLTGAVGSGVVPGNNRLITWNAGVDWNGNWSGDCRVRLWAHDGTTPVPPLGMVYIPSGTFDMGSGPGIIGVPVTLTRSYFMDRTEVSAEKWHSVRSWAVQHGYPDIGQGAYREPGHPIQTVDWFECIKWCNARSEMEGLEPCYYKDVAKTQIYKTGSDPLTAAHVKWTASGFRLPTDAEWERAARGGLYRKRFSWGDEITPGQANYLNSGDPFENGVLDFDPRSTPCGYYNGSQTPSGPDMGNGYGLYDMIGNVWEWCWDTHGPLIAGTDPKGAETSNNAHVIRGGSFLDVATDGLKLTTRYSQAEKISYSPYYRHLGFRTVRFF